MWERNNDIRWGNIWGYDSSQMNGLGLHAIVRQSLVSYPTPSTVTKKHEVGWARESGQLHASRAHTENYCDSSYALLMHLWVQWCCQLGWCLWAHDY